MIPLHVVNFATKTTPTVDSTIYGPGTVYLHVFISGCWAFTFCVAGTLWCAVGIKRIFENQAIKIARAVGVVDTNITKHTVSGYHAVA